MINDNNQLNDNEVNTSFKGKFVVKAFRIAHSLRTSNKIIQILSLPYLIFYRIFIEWLMGIEIPPLTKVGPGLAIHHGQGLVINNKAVIGAGCTLRHGVTIGNKGVDDACPILEDGVDVGANAIILGSITIGKGAVIGAGAVVTKDVVAGAVMVGNPARNLS
jgi:serine acetyltransferase